ncbi:MAG: IS630 family transposase [Anaerolineae bacterium]|nr:IS630 family transposase [Anaerolineae bacterium]
MDFSLGNEQLEVLEEAIKFDERPEVVKRAMALRLLHYGHRPEAVAEIMLVTASTVYQWRHRWDAEGLTGLVDRPRSGRPRKADEKYCQLLGEALEADPESFGYAFTVWTSDRLRAHLERLTGISLSPGRFSILMDELGYVYRRPKRDLTAKQDQDAKQQAAELLDELKKGRNVVISSFSLWTKRPSV